ncbi:MAG: hypothetical protein ABL997_04095 [Planctomycetota bacterium]
MRAPSRLALLAVVSLVAVDAALAQSRVVVPAVATDLPGNAAMSMPLRWSQGVLQVWIAPQLLPPVLTGATLQGLRLRRPTFLSEPAYPAVQRTITVRAGIWPLIPPLMSTARALNMPATAIVVAGPSPFAVAASTLPSGAPAVGAEFLVIPFTTPLQMQPGTLCLEFETSDAPFATSEQWVDAVWMENGVDAGYAVTVGDGTCTTGSAPLQLSWTGTNAPSRGGDATLRVSGAPPAAPNGPGSLVLAWAGASPQTRPQAADFFGFGIDLAGLDPGLSGCYQWSPLDVVISGFADAAGGFDVQFALPTTLPAGLRVGVQTAFLDLARPGVLPLSLSNGVVMQLDSAGVSSRCSSIFFPGAAATSPWSAEVGLMPVLVFDF